MPSKFVARAAERTGVSLETAEHRWAEAKKKVHKGKRRGSWYWGKVMNTFKRMMGLMEAVTLKEWLLFEEDDAVEQLCLAEAKELSSIQQGTKNWPRQFITKDGYTVEFREYGQTKMTYVITRLMSDGLKGYVRVSKRPSLQPFAGGKKAFKYYWQIANENDRPQATMFVSDGGKDPFDFGAFKHWVSTHAPLLLKESA